MARTPARRFDIVLFGATGFTGRLVAEYLTRRAAGTSLRWALSGRSTAKLEQVRSELAAIDAAARDLAILEADCHDQAAIDRIARDTRVVCTTVGPYAQHGVTLVDACARAGTHYCDLAGEVPFIRASIDRNHDEARRTGARIVHCCGFDSIPSDLGVLSLQHELTARTGGPAKKITALFGETKGAFSGGTVASLLGVIDAAARDRAARKVLGDPYGLDPAGSPRGPDHDVKAPGYDRTLGKVTAPFLMAAINTRVVRRSHALLGHPWGTDWSYDERMSLPRSPVGVAAAVAITGALAGFVAGSQVPWVRKQIEHRLPRPGEGPTADQRARGHWTVRLYGENGGKRVVMKLADRLDPGYAGTAKLLGESALCLAEDELATPTGVLTPATAMGLTLVERLREAGVTWETSEA
ncbi:MAG TPA: saccharopine dehydrogenase NADP-binding domain-containing protein [Kofleriaceae bacterium]|nr:saccharopine dehydrogenase NADP-binding domain-containing protein [Kofleriaceae bacterium]